MTLDMFGLQIYCSSCYLFYHLFLTVCLCSPCVALLSHCGTFSTFPPFPPLASCCYWHPLEESGLLSRFHKEKVHRILSEISNIRWWQPSGNCLQFNSSPSLTSDVKYFMILTRVYYTVKLRSSWNFMEWWGFFRHIWDKEGISVSRKTLWRKWWISSCLLYWRVKHPLLTVVQTTDRSPVKCSWNSLKALKWSYWQLCIPRLPQAWLTAACSIWDES